MPRRRGRAIVIALGRERLTELTGLFGPAVVDDVTAVLETAHPHPTDAGTSRGDAGSTVPRATVEALVERHGLASPVELALLALPAAGALARPAISGYRVAAIGIEAESGDLVLGGNLEFPGAELGSTIHAEGFVALRTRRRGRTLGVLALRSARPCAHCRQTLSESAAADGLRLIDLDGNDLGLADLYPQPFRPDALGMDGDAPDQVAWPDLALGDAAAPAGVAAALLQAGRRAHAPYSGSPSAAVLTSDDGRQVSAGCVESVAFNPSISALQAALVEAVAAGIDLASISDGWLASTDGGTIDPEPGFRALLRAAAPGARGHVVRWRTGSRAS